MALYLVTGPPAAGKSTWVRQQAQPGDITIDYDAIACTLAVPGDDPHDHPDHVKQVTKAARQAAIDTALTLAIDHDVYVIHSTPSPTLLAHYQRHGARTVTIDPGYDIVMQRAQAERPRRIQQAAKNWYNEKDCTTPSDKSTPPAATQLPKRDRHSIPGYRRLVAEFREQCSRQLNPDGTNGAPCWRCRKPIDYSLRPAHRQYIAEAFEADHFHSVKTHPHLTLEIGNLRPSHAVCNRERGAEDPGKSEWGRAATW